MANIQFKDIRKSYGDVAVVHGISLDIRDGEFIVIVGPSGCGKSTLLRMVAGLEQITSGELIIGERVVNNLEPKDRDCAMVFQNYALYPHMTVFDNMAYGLKIRGVPKDEIERRVNEAAKMLELGGLLARRPRQLSGGQRQRVAMAARSCASPPSFSSTNRSRTSTQSCACRRACRSRSCTGRLKTTSLYVTHDQVEAMTLAHRMIVMNAGRAEQVGTPQEVYDDPETMFVANFIGSPPMNLVHGRVSADGSHFEHDSGVLSLPEPCTALAGRAVVLGVRPEHVTLRPEGGLAAFEVETVEALGADHLIHGVLLGQNVVFRVDNHMYIPEVGIRAGLEFSSEHVYWFDPETTKRIRL